MSQPDWLEDYVDEVNSSSKFGLYIAEGLDVTNLDLINQRLLTDGLKPLSPDKHRYLLDLYGGKDYFLTS